MTRRYLAISLIFGLLGTWPVGAASGAPGDCKLPSGTVEGPQGQPPYKSAVGDVQAIMLFVDFPDVQAAGSTETYFNLLNPATAWYSDVSYGKLRMTITPIHRWLRMPKRSADYGMKPGATTYEIHRAYLADAVAVADPTVDFSGYELLYVVSPKEATEIPFSPSLNGFAGTGISADGNELTNGANFGVDIWNPGWGPHVVVHESGHNFGLPDLYDFDTSSDPPQANNHGFVGGWDVMGYIGGPARGYFAWHRWIIGWLDDVQIDCISTDGTTEHTLAPLETPGGTKAVAVRLDANRVLVAENRQAIGTDSGACETGLLVYLVDGSKATGGGPIRVLDAQPDVQADVNRCQPHNQATFDKASGEVSTFSDAGLGVAIEVLSNSGGSSPTLTVRVTRSKDSPLPSPTATPSPDGSPSPTPTSTEEPQRLASNTTLTVGGGRRMKISGSVEPAHPGFAVAVTLFKRSGGRFVRLGKESPTLDASSTYSTAFARPRSGVCRLVVRFPGDGDHLASKATKRFSCSG